jgi:hypothetical protein
VDFSVKRNGEGARTALRTSCPFLAQYDPYNRVGLLVGGNTNPRRHEAISGPGLAFVVADNKEARGELINQDFIPVAVTRDARGGNDRHFGHTTEHGSDEHRFHICLVKGFYDHGGALKNRGNVRFVKCHAMGLNVNIGVHSIQIDPCCLRFVHADLVDKVVLAIKVARFDYIEIGDDETPNSHPTQSCGTTGTKASQPGDPNGRTFQRLVNARSMTGHHETLHFFGTRHYSTPYELDTVPFVKILISSGRKPVKDDYIGIRLYPFPNLEQASRLVHFEGFFINENFHLD